MRRALAAVFVFLVLTGALAVSRSRASSRPRRAQSAALLHAEYDRGLDSLSASLDGLAALAPDSDSISVRSAFRRARAAYKRIEYLVEFEDPSSARGLNGVPQPTPNEEDPLVEVTPTGLQVIETVLYPRQAPDFMRVVREQVENMRSLLPRIRQAALDTREARRRGFDAARLEVARVATLGLAGFDATLSRDGLRESAEALRGVLVGLRVYQAPMQAVDPTGWADLERTLSQGIAALEAAPDFDRFDRLGFVAGQVGPISGALGRLERALAFEPSHRATPWSAGATNIYARGAIDPAYFAPDYAPSPTPELLTLGQRLFFDPSLSARGQRSCATCHQPARAFTDGRAKADVDPGPGLVRNTPTLLNAGLQAALLADQRAPFLEFQVYDVLANPREMGLPAPEAARRLQRDSALVAQFALAFRLPAGEALTDRTLTMAVAAYVRSLRTLSSRFDRAVEGDTTALSPAERRGFTLFMGKAHCGTCHFPPLFGGTFARGNRGSEQSESEPEVIGVPVRPLGGPVAVDPDPGMFGRDQAPSHRHAFKTPILRNVAVTAPYMHNGVFRTLDEVVEFYDRGGGNGLGMRLPNQTLPAEPLHLSAGEKHDLVAFLGSLTDSTSPVAVRLR